MTIRRKAVMGTGTAVIGLLLIMYVLIRVILIHNFEALEEKQLRTDVSRAVDSLSGDIDMFFSTLTDYAAWNDTYQYAQDQNPEYVSSNLEEFGFSKIGINFLVITDASGKIIYSAGYDLNKEEPLSIPQTLLTLFSGDSSLARHSDPENGKKGILLTDDGAFIFGTFPIVASDYSGPIQGSFAMARIIDDEKVKSIGDKTHLDLAVLRHDDPALPTSLQKEKTGSSDPLPITIFPDGKSEISAYTPLSDVFGNPAIVVKVKQKREIYNQGITMLHYFTLSLIVLGGLLCGIVYLATGSIIKPVQRIIGGLSQASNDVETVARQVSSESRGLAEGASLQAAAVEETSSTLEEMSSATRQNAANAVQAEALMEEVSEIVHRAADVVSGLTRSMNEISEASEKTQKVLKTIDAIAFQTNLLALNAAVEAARAGEAGAGFAVVADEVRNLSMRAADAARNTGLMIEETGQRIQAGATLVENTGNAFDQIKEQTRKVNDLIKEITTASSEQSKGIENVAKAVEDMNQVTRRNTTSSEESTSASEDMHLQAEQMTQFIQELATLVGGN